MNKIDWSDVGMWTFVVSMCVLSIAMIFGALWLVAAMFSSVGYVILLLTGKTYTFWTGAMVGLGSLILIGSVGAVLGHVFGKR